MAPYITWISFEFTHMLSSALRRARLMYGTADRETVKEKRKIRHFLALVTMATNPIIPSGNSLSPRHA